ncbi:hypothetical protein [Emticicia sp. 17c]|uniref:hypothetical protein n=1 Tax=Emticicia sp. 17c TaxID=3127704 RepID=UPI00301D224E
MNDNYTIIRTLQSKLADAESQLKAREDLVNAQKAKLEKLTGKQTEAIKLLNQVEFKTNKVFESHVKQAINLLK